MTSLPGIARILGISGILRNDVIFQEMAPGIPPRTSCSPDTKSKNWVLDRKNPILYQENMIDEEVSEIQISRAFFEYLLAHHVLLIQSRKFGFSIEKSDFVSGEHDVRGGIRKKRGKFKFQKWDSRLKNPDFSTFYQENMIGEEVSQRAISWKVTSFLRIPEIPRIPAIPGSDVIFQELPVFGLYDRRSRFFDVVSG
ncbi:unnamed protein product [Xylocopa violacea]|uniref:Uncharacterized protein n=1 Tax=Xylocopa violacea TaxID=135666 RepID=A0ABP1N0X1_XYLVO